MNRELLMMACLSLALTTVSGRAESPAAFPRTATTTGTTYPGSAYSISVETRMDVPSGTTLERHSATTPQVLMPITPELLNQCDDMTNYCAGVAVGVGVGGSVSKPQTPCDLIKLWCHPTAP